ncbi:V-set and immunoglobulin domain-containing protein 4-like isoform X2 [Pezoporus wallicus]|uniref:V-set and immunoglobulin domain-containing protein 4-like isoform X2 n=1 Tax=Pezoporus wallicus TaxID=35540 RepID=UPI00254A6C71|nr:V-set and immunoglobulin domain-containing protein 4-like isoform X2 [Pezoporus wallicus]
MGEPVQIVVFVMAFVTCNALLDLTGVHQVQGTWMGSVTLPCTYMPSDGFTQQTLIWSMERDHSTSTIFRRDYSGDHILLSQFRNRVSVPKHSPGNASLLIENLEIPDSGHYTCQVTWRTKNNSVITREVTTAVKVVKVAATKPIIRAGELGLTVPAGARTSLTCVASGSPPIRYRWFRGTPGRKALLLSGQAELVWDSLQPSDTGKYYCEVENRAGAGAVQQSDAVELTVTGLTATKPRSEGGSEEPPVATELLYEVAFHSTADVTRLETDGEVPVKCPQKDTNSKTETSNDIFTVKDSSLDSIHVRKNPEYENLMNAMELEYETERI